MKGQCGQWLSRVLLFVARWIVARQAPLPIEFSRKEYWSGVPFPSSGDLPDPGIKYAFLMSPALAGGFFKPRAVTQSWMTEAT